MTSTERKMAAIIAMDVTSYSEKMGRDHEVFFVASSFISV